MKPAAAYQKREPFGYRVVCRDEHKHRTTAYNEVSFADLLVAVSVCISFAPTYYLNDPSLRLYGIPLPYYLFSTGVVLLAIKYASRLRYSFYLVAALLLFLFMLTEGLIFDNELRWIPTDCVIFGGLIAGMAWGQVKGATRMASFLTLLGLVAIVLFAFNLHSSGEYRFQDLESKNVVYLPFWILSGVVTFTAPIVYFCRDDDSDRRPYWRGLLVILGFACSLYTAFFTATRSTLVCTFVVMAVFLRIMARGRAIATAFAVLLPAVVLAGAIWSGPILTSLVEETELGTKWQTHSVWDDPRYFELLQLLDHLQGRELVGMGFGSRYDYFLRSGTTEDAVTALAPHLGAFAFLQKGGIFTYLIFIVIPFLLALSHLAFPGKTNRCGLAAWSCVFSYVVFTSCTTGGWDFVNLFFYGAFLSVALDSKGFSAHNQIHNGSKYR